MVTSAWNCMHSWFNSCFQPNKLNEVKWSNEALYIYIYIPFPFLFLRILKSNEAYIELTASKITLKLDSEIIVWNSTYNIIHKVENKSLDLQLNLSAKAWKEEIKTLEGLVYIQTPSFLNTQWCVYIVLLIIKRSIIYVRKG